MAARSILNKLEPKMEALRDTVTTLEETLKSTYVNIQDVNEVQDKIQDRVDVLEEEVTALKAQNSGLKDHLNMVIDITFNMMIILLIINMLITIFCLW